MRVRGRNRDVQRFVILRSITITSIDLRDRERVHGANNFAYERNKDMRGIYSKDIKRRIGRSLKIFLFTDERSKTRSLLAK